MSTKTFSNPWKQLHLRLAYSLQRHPISTISPLQDNMPYKKSRLAKPWSMHPALHDNVSRLLEEDNLRFNFHELDDATGCTRDYDTNIMGRFICHKNTCASHGWSSKQIAITIRMYPNSKYNARVYHQRCKSCNSLSQPLLDHSYAERIAYRLKKWQGIVMELPPHSGESRGPHNSDLCEGCRHGHCSGAFLWWSSARSQKNQKQIWG